MRTALDDLIEEAAPPRRAGWYAWGVLLVLLVGIPFACTVSAQERLTLDCRDVAAHISLAAWARDMKADENLVAIYISKVNQHIGLNLVRGLEREVRRLWKEQQPAGKAIEAAYKRCQAQLGDLGAEG